MLIVVLAGIAALVVLTVAVLERHRIAKRSDVDVESCLRNVGRLNAPAATRLADAPQRIALDALTSEAAERLHAPMAMMTLLDERRAFVAGSANGTRSYLGVPLRTRSGQTIGSFCVVDTVARQWTDDEIVTLEQIADRAMAGVSH